MTEDQNRHTAVAESATIAVADELDELIRDTEVAAREWGVRRDHLEWRFVSALLCAVRWLGRLMSTGTTDLKATMTAAQKTAEIELAKLRAATEAANLAVRQAKLAQTCLEVQRETLVSKMVENIAPQLAAGVKDWVVIRERRYNRNVEWARFFATAAVVLGLVVGGYVWRTVQDWPATDALENCLAHQFLDAASGKHFCEIELLMVK